MFLDGLVSTPLTTLDISGNSIGTELQQVIDAALQSNRARQRERQEPPLPPAKAHAEKEAAEAAAAAKTKCI